MSMSKKDFVRVAEGFRYVANDPAADEGTVKKVVHEFCSAAVSLNPRFDESAFKRAVFGERK